MLFTSWKFIAFLIVIILLYPLVPGRFRRIYLLLASLYFYSGFGLTAFLVLLSVNLLSFFSALVIGNKDTESGDNSGNQTFRRTVLIITLLIMFFSLGIFKWSAFGLLLPVGMSFYIFTAAGYCIDVYRGKAEPEKSPVTCFLFLSFFPNITSGPIERTHTLLPQIRTVHTADRPRFHMLCSGFIAILWGYFLKLVIAERVALLVNNVWSEYYLFGSVELFLAAFLYVFQLYSDFSGYSLIAIGAAKMLGFDLKENFHAPLLSSSPAEFWIRWHKSLMDWFRDYIYIPLGGNRKGYGRKLINSLVVFLVSGIWHGSSPNFPVWGLICGVVVIFCDLFKRQFGGKDTAAPSSFSHRFWTVCLTFFTIAVTFVSLRADSLTTACSYACRMFTHFDPWVLFDGSLYNLGLSRAQFMVLVPALLLMFFTDLLIDRTGLQFNDFIMKQGLWLKVLTPGLLLFVILAYGIYGPGFDAGSFLYFNF